MNTIVTFGEIMGRLCPPDHLRFRQAMPGSVDLTFAGAEANVAASLSMLGKPVRFVTALPQNDLTTACLASLAGLGVDTRQIVTIQNGRFGLYFVETGANQRPSRVIYDRDGSSFSIASAAVYDWDTIFDGASWFHTTGISPALSRTAAETTIEAVRRAKKAGLTVSCDLNFRKKLWKWDTAKTPGSLARETMKQILPHVDLVIGNEEDAADVLGIKGENTDVHAGQIDAAKYTRVAQQIIEQFPCVSRVAITLRESISASHNNWGALLYDGATERAVFAPMRENSYAPYEIRSIVDRVGGGDAFGAGLIFALNTPEYQTPERAVAFATAASCLAHSIYGDFNYHTREEVEALINQGGSGRVER